MSVSVIAEIGCNHQGSVDTAIKMVELAAQICSVPIVKFQKRCPSVLLSPDEYEKPHPRAENAFGPTYGAHREFLELDIDAHRILKKKCDDIGLIYSCSVWDMVSAEQILSINPKIIKIPSAKNLDLELINFISLNFEGSLHISLGMTTSDEIDIIVEQLRRCKKIKNTVIYACTSGYPVPFSQLGLLEISRLIEKYGNEVAGIGFSGHHNGIAADIAAMTLGANFIERHFTLDRTWKGTDHAASLEPDGLRRLVRDVKAVQTALTPRPSEGFPIEAEQREKLKRPRSLPVALDRVHP